MLQIEAGRHKNLLMADRLRIFCKELYIFVLEDVMPCLYRIEICLFIIYLLFIYTEYILQQLTS